MKILGFLFRLILVVALIVWLADRPGEAHIVWRGYEIQSSAAVLGVIMLALAYGAVLLHRLWRFVWDGPRFWKMGRRLSKMEEGQEEIAKGFAALAAGQAAQAGRAATLARKKIGETPMTRLLQAQAAQLAGDHGAARSLFEAMTQDKATAALGYRGLIVGALRRGDETEAAAQIRRLEQSGISAPWLHLLRLETGARQREWGGALDALGKLRKARALPTPRADLYEGTLLLARAQEDLRAGQPMRALEAAERARRLAPEDLAASLLLARAQIATRHERAALRTLEKAWHRAPHPQLARLAFTAASPAKPIDAYRLIEKWTRGDHEDDPAALMALAEAAFKADLWGEARRCLMRLVTRGIATRGAYQLLARIERRETGREEAAAAWLAKALDAPADPAWLCASCGAAHEDWAGACSSCGAWGTLSWGQVGGRKQRARSSLLESGLLSDEMGGA